MEKLQVSGRLCSPAFHSSLCTPAAGGDYAPLPVTNLAFDASTSQDCVDFTILSDNRLESVENFIVSATTNGLVSPVTATVSITDSTSMCTTPVVM